LAQVQLEARLKHKQARLTALLNFKKNSTSKPVLTKRLIVRLATML
jgi:hypothetical protein